MICVANPGDFVPHAKAPVQSYLGYAPFFSRIRVFYCMTGTDWQPYLWYSKVIIIIYIYIKNVLLDKFKVRPQD